ncbi:MAG: thiamine diphosphokinase [Bacillota bacterium]|nr:thiamine diphosphokinase [Bacillota bacterium]
MPLKKVVIIANGDFKNHDFYRRLMHGDDYLICVNGGTGHTLAMGLSPDLIIGDLDSLAPGDSERIASLKPRLIKHPQAKNKSDLELAIDQAVDMKPAEILLIGILGGKRVDHAFANLLLLMIPHRAGIPARIVDEKHEIRMIGDEAIFKGKKGDYLSLFSLTDKTVVIETTGLKFPLKDESLFFSSTRGLSNELTQSRARVKIKSGLLLTIKVS